jgi:hypothetical protein
VAPPSHIDGATVSASRYRVLGLAHARSAWFRELSRWSTNAALPVEFVKCVAIEELRARLASGQAFSAVIVDGGLAGVDRDLVDRTREAGAAVFVVDDGRRRVDWTALGADLVLPESFDRALVLSALVTRAPALEHPDVEPGYRLAPPPAAWRGRLVAVTGPDGGGSSTVAMALTQGFGSSSRHLGLVALADLALHADLALLHDAGDVVPGLQELVEAHRTATPSVEQVRAHAFAVDGRGYDLILGLRRHRDWPVLRPRAVQAAVDSLLRTYRLVVADVDGDLEGDDDVGSVDVEERNVLARTAAARADLVVVVGPPSLSGIRRLVLQLDELHRFGVTGDRLLTVVSRAPRRARARAEIADAIATLTTACDTDLAAGLAAPVFVAERRGIDELQRTSRPLPHALVNPITDVVEALLDRAPILPAGIDGLEPTPVAVGSLGSWSDESDDR